MTWKTERQSLNVELLKAVLAVQCSHRAVCKKTSLCCCFLVLYLMPLTSDFYTIPAAFLFKCTFGGFNKHFSLCWNVVKAFCIWIHVCCVFMLSCMCMCVFFKKCCVSFFFSSAVLVVRSVLLSQPEMLKCRTVLHYV